jgi:diguanylate cyclase (GGDEF)-like protein
MKANKQSFSILVQQVHPEMRELLKLVLGTEGYRVLTAATPKQALSKVKKYSPRLAIIEISDKKGVEFIQRLRSIPVFRSLYLIILSSERSDKEKVSALDLGANDFITKPFIFIDLLARVRVGIRSVSLHTELEDKANKDSLTGLLNRRALETLVKQEFKRALKTGSSLSVLMVDVDDFKPVNDIYGHQAGDWVLRKVARIIHTTGREFSIPCRYGGEEFCLVLFDRKIESCIATAEKIREKIKKTSFRYARETFSVTVSTGISSTSLKNYSTIQQLVADADRALYAAKKNGKNCVKLFMPAELVTRTYRED